MSTHTDNPRLPRTPIRVSLDQELLLQDLLDVTTTCANLANVRRGNDHKAGREISKVGIRELVTVANWMALRNVRHGDNGLWELIQTEEGLGLVRGVIHHADKRSYDGWNKHLNSKRYRTEYKKNGKKRVRWFNKPHSKKRDSIQIPSKFVQFSGEYCEVQGLGRLDICRTDLDWSQPVDLRYITIKRSGAAGWSLSAWQGSEWWGMQRASQFPHDDDYYLCDVIGIDMNTSNIVSCYDGTEKWTVDLPDFTAEDKVLALCRERIATTSHGSREYHKWVARKEKAIRRKTNKLMSAHLDLDHDIIKRRPRFIVLEDIHIVELSEANDGRYRHGWMTACANQWRRLLTEKGFAAQNGITVITAPSHFPSTKLCPNPECGHKQDMPTEVRRYECPVCGIEEDRDEAAAISLYHFGLLQVAQDHEGYAPSYLKWVNTGKIA